MKKLLLAGAIVVPFFGALHAADLRVRTVDAIIYNGLLYPEMGTIAGKMKARGQNVEVLWHDAQTGETRCPRFLLGHSMGANAALRQAAYCVARGHHPVVVSIDPGRAPLDHLCPAGTTCINYYDPTHPIGGQYVDGARNIIVSGYTHLQLPAARAVVVGTLAATKF